ncbi:MAG: hypothetical protein KGJ89_05180 [Patescibacteria group bacterium]|nr:hypothetical protein [Patescibacteria group bacterium]MDE2227315.1 hypothetical protein [Patescibacteria group bacterium]
MKTFEDLTDALDYLEKVPLEEVVMAKPMLPIAGKEYIFMLKGKPHPATGKTIYGDTSEELLIKHYHEAVKGAVAGGKTGDNTPHSAGGDGA